MNQRIRYTEIDLLRFIAAFSVMMFHYTKIFPDLVGIGTYGRLGVHLFFIISGFVILMSAMGLSARSFMISRAVRLYPSFWVCCTITFLVSLWIGIPEAKLSLGRYLANLTLIHEFFGIGHVDGVYWTLTIEIKFYILIWILLITKQLKMIEYYLGIWVIISILALNYFSTPLQSWFITKFSSYFIVGSVFYLISIYGPNFYRLFLVAACFVLSLANINALNGGSEPLSYPVLVTLTTLFFIVFFFIALGKTTKIRSNVYIFWGTLTYPLYLLHSHLWYVIYTIPGIKMNYFGLAGMTVAMLGLAYAVHLLAEKRGAPILKGFLNKIPDFKTF